MMPTFLHGKDSKVYLDEFDLSAYFNSADLSLGRDTAETTAYGATSKAYIAGLVDGTVSLSGMWSADTDGTDEELQAILGATTTPVLTVALSAGTIGNRAVMAQAHETTYSVSSPIADIVTISADFQASTDATSNLTYALSTGVQLTTGASVAFGSLGDLASVNNSASSANGGMGLLHVPTNSVAAGATTIKVQHSADDSSWADLITFSSVGASTVTSEMSAISGTVNQYLRATASTAGTSGSITFMVTFGRF
jgi:hypothetical protein